jgi:hypothetical protein
MRTRNSRKYIEYFYVKLTADFYEKKKLKT